MTDCEWPKVRMQLSAFGLFSDLSGDGADISISKVFIVNHFPPLSSLYKK